MDTKDENRVDAQTKGFGTEPAWVKAARVAIAAVMVLALFIRPRRIL